MAIEFLDPEVPVASEIEFLDEPTQIPVEQTPLAQMVAGGYQPTRQELQRVAAQRLVERERAAGFRPNDLLLRSEAEQLATQAGIPLGNVGEVVSTSQFEPGLQGRILEAVTGTRAAASAAGLNVPGALGRGLEDLVLNNAQQRILGSQAMRQRAPEVDIGGTLVGSAIPTKLVGGAALSAGAPLLQKVTQGAKIGAPVGGLAAYSTTAEQGGSAQELITNTLLGTGAGLAVGGGVPLAANVAGSAIEATGRGLRSLTTPIKTLQNSGVLRTNEAIVIDIINPSGEGAVREAAEGVLNGDLLKGFQTIKKTGEFTSLPTLIEKGEATLPNLIKEVDTFVTQNPTIKINTSDAAEAMVQRVSQDPLLAQRNPEVIELVQANAANFNKDFSLKQAFDLLKSINKRHKDYFTATAKGQSTKLQDAEFETDEIARKYLSGKLNDAIEGVSGVERNPYREYGAVNEIVLQTGKRYSKALVDRLKETSQTGVVSDFLKNFDITRPLASIARPATFLRGGELGRLNRRVESLNKGLPAKEPIKVLTEAERLQKLQGKISTPPLLPEAQAQSALDAQLAQELADLQQAQAIQAQTGTGSFAPSLEQILQTQGLEEQILNQQAAQRRLQGAIGESVAGVPYY